MGVATKIGEIAKEKGITLKELSRRADIPYTTLYNAVRRDSKVDFDIACKISAALGVEWVDLYPDNKSASMAYINAANDFMKEHPGGFKKISPDEAAELGIINDQTAASLNAFQSRIHQKHILEDFAALNDKGQEEAAKRVHELTLLPEYSNSADKK